MVARLWKAGLCVVVLAVLAAPSTWAEVKIATGANGRKVIFNESVAQHARRFASHLLPIPDTDLEPLIMHYSEAQSLDPKLVRAVIQAESGYNRKALSNKGAMGLMQLMPETASLLNVRHPYDPDENLRGGTAYLRTLLDRFAGRTELAVAAYNAGPGAVEKHRGIPPYLETREYVRRVLSLFRGDEPAMTMSATQGPAVMPGRRKPYIIRNSQNQIVITTAIGGQR
jgi:soluble lytic murein transglycosylase-like protein